MIRAIEIENRRTTPQEEWTTVTKVNYPRIHEAFEIISHDGGSSAGHPCYYVPPEHAPMLHDVEYALAGLTSNELQTFCIGEQDEMNRIAQSQALQRAHDMLDAFWRDWEAQD